MRLESGEGLLDDIRPHKFLTWKWMGFYLWLDGEVAWAQGTYEYRPLGAAVISSSDLFRRRDFDARRRPQPTGAAVFAGQFASLGHLNVQMRKQRNKS